MEDTTNRSPVGSLRSEFRTRAALVDERVVTSDELLSESDSAPEAPAAPARRKTKAATANQFTGPLAPAQFKLPSDLLQSLKLHAIDSNETMSEIVLRCLTSGDLIEKAWISTRKAS
jgi:hypothetical protein